MKVKVSLAKYDLPGAVKVVCHEERRLFEYRIPGMEGSAWQDLGARPFRVEIFGSVFGDELRGEFLAEIRQKYLAAEPVVFVADAIEGSGVEEVVIEKLNVRESSKDHNILKYDISLAKYVPPPVDQVPGDIGTELDTEAAGSFDSMVDLAVEDNLLSDFTEQFSELDLDNILDELPTDLLDDLLELIGAGYEEPVEVFSDLADAIEGDEFDPGSTVAGAAKIAAKLVVTLLGPKGEESWVGELAEKFKEII